MLQEHFTQSRKINASETVVLRDGKYRDVSRFSDQWLEADCSMPVKQRIQMCSYPRVYCTPLISQKNLHYSQSFTLLCEILIIVVEMMELLRQCCRLIRMYLKLHIRRMYLTP